MRFLIVTPSIPLEQAAPLELQLQQLRTLARDLRVLHPKPPILVVARSNLAQHRLAGELASAAGGAVCIHTISLLAHQYLSATRLAQLIDFLNRVGADAQTVILVTSPVLTAALPSYIAHHHWQRSDQFQPLLPGQMRLLDLVAHRCLSPSLTR